MKAKAKNSNLNLSTWPENGYFQQTLFCCSPTQTAFSAYIFSRIFQPSGSHCCKFSELESQKLSVLNLTPDGGKRMRGKGKRTLLRNNSRIHQEKIYFNFPERLESHSRPFVNQSPRKIVYAAEKFFVLCVKKFSIFSLTLPLGL